MQVGTYLINNVIEQSDSNSYLTTVSSLTACTGNKQSNKIILKRREQLRCMWCSRVNLLDRKTTLMCQEYKKGFCRDENNILSCCSYHVALGGVTHAPKYGTRKRNLNECMEALILSCDKVISW